MPTVHYERGCRFYFNSNENNEPPHIHIYGKFSRKGGRMKVWLKNNCEIAESTPSRGIPDHEQTKLLAIVRTKKAKFLKEWYEFKKREQN